MENINKMKVERPVTPSAPTGMFINALHKNTSKGLTENDAVTYTDSGSALLNFFAQAGAMRKNPEKALELFKKAFAEDRQNALKILFYLRDVRGGQGERDLFRTSLQWVGMNYSEVFEKIIEHVPEYGRWDDMFFDHPKAIHILREQLTRDGDDSERPSLLAKWLPTINASSPTTRAKARFFAKHFELNDMSYRKLIAGIRKRIKIVESQMSAGEWGGIDYSAVPSQASRIYKNAFKKHDEKRYGAFIDKATSGEEKINAGTLYPYQIYKSAMNDYSKTLEALWNQLPDYTRGKDALVVADVSGSMSGDPIAVSVSLALYFAERNKGKFNGHFITFSANPRLQRISGQTLHEKMISIERSQWDMNTNLQAVFDLILGTALANNIPASEMPSTLYIISDMEFDRACDRHTNFEVIKEKYAAMGYEVPSIVFWNVDARSGENLPVRDDEKNVSMVSGFSPTIFKMAVENKSATEVMLDTINAERYARIVV